MIKTIETTNELNAMELRSNTIVVHSGVFHAHDVFACLLMADEYFNYLSIIRTRNAEAISELASKGAIICDVGMGQLDHHSWKGYKGLSTMFPMFHTYSPDQIAILESVAMIDCGIEAVDYVSSMISSFNPCWNEANTSEAYDIAFEKALEFAKVVWSNPLSFISLKHRELARQAGEAEAAEIADQAMLDCAGSYLLILPRFIPWQKKVVEYNEKAHQNKCSGFVWVLFESTDGSWRVQAVPKSAESFEFISPVGAVAGKHGCTFVHPNRFICGYETKEQALRAVRSW